MNYIDNILTNLWIAAHCTYKTDAQKIAQDDVYCSIEWYINTCRASTSWIKAIGKANPTKLFAYIIKQDDQSVTGQIASATKYITRYCQY